LNSKTTNKQTFSKKIAISPGMIACVSGVAGLEINRYVPLHIIALSEVHVQHQDM
jgi:hypothetical protein